MSFDRLTFDPFTNHKDLVGINRLRGYGGSRQCPSLAADQGFTWYKRDPIGKRFLDMGCGDSRDWIHARDKGYDSWRVDLFPPRIDRSDCETAYNPNFYRRDITQRLPFASGSFNLIICQAVIDLVRPDERILVYREAKRLLAPDGIFIVIAQKLKLGWGITDAVELETLRTLFPTVKGYTGLYRCHQIRQMSGSRPDPSYVGGFTYDELQSEAKCGLL